MNNQEDKKLSHDFIGYNFIKRYDKKTDSVLIEMWQNIGNNNNSFTPTANGWKLISFKLQNKKSWSKPPSDHQLHGFSNGPVKEDNQNE